MKIWMVSLLSLILGAALVAVPATMLVLDTTQRIVSIQNQIYTVNIEKLEANDEQDLLELSCLALLAGLQLDNELQQHEFASLFMPDISKENAQTVNAKSREMFEASRPCHDKRPFLDNIQSEFSAKGPELAL